LYHLRQSEPQLGNTNLFTNALYNDLVAEGHNFNTDCPLSMPISFPQSGAGPSSTPSNESYPSFPSSISSSGSGSGSDVSSDYSSDDDDERERALIREEWEDSLRQMQMLFSIVLVPFFGKWMGRRWSYWGKF
jgi:hypothetical protein